MVSWGIRELVRAVRRFTRPLTAILLAQTLVAYSYFISSAVFVQYPSTNLGLSDIQASVLYSAFGMLITIFGIFTGVMADHMGTFSGMGAGALLALLGRVLYVATPHFATPRMAAMVSTGLIATLIPLGESIMAQMCMIGIKRHAAPPDADSDEAPTSIRDSRRGAFSAVTHASHGAMKRAPQSSQAIEYAMSYMLQNVAAVMAYVTIGVASAAFGNETMVNRVVLMCSLPPLILLLLVTLYGHTNDTYDIDMAVAVRENDIITDDNIYSEMLTSSNRPTYKRTQELKSATQKHVRSDERKQQRLPWCERVRPRWASRVLFTGPTGALLARYLVVSLLLIGAKTTFRHLEATLPKYTQRLFYKNYPYSLMIMINPAMIILFSALAQAFLLRFDALKTIIVGTVVCSAGTLLAMIPYEWGAVAFVVVFSIGEIVWSPRMTDYIFQLAPRGHEGTFSSLASIPIFVAKFPVGIMSGLLLDNYCPRAGACESVPMWGIIAACAATSPIGLTLAYTWVVRPDIQKAQKEKLHGRRHHRDENEEDTDGIVDTLYTNSTIDTKTVPLSI